MLPLYAANVLNWQPAMLACQIFVQNILCVPLQAAHVMTWQPAMLAYHIFVQPYVNMKAINASCYYVYIYIYKFVYIYIYFVNNIYIFVE